ncbi:SRPBCC family protein [Umezawaea endophytica]|uniref:SRPBCC domain-containing protein n=1 Tax=Umezawaea endophytica TaxID=1654476 RepID=A0A9X2VVT7_9PSEU|nr:SRPBCC domain-containing protein [Umezawaea endophytica]MCS7483551.1 SRPBCC domain-containing protein [Umezawaea endophytica]
MNPVIESVAVEIDVPAAFAWDVLTDYARYPLWNPYTIEVDTTLVIGSPIDLTLPNPNGGGGTFVSREYVRVVDPPRLLRYDTGDTFPGLTGVRDQWLTALGPARCRYLTRETFTGRLADVVLAAQGAWVKTGFDAVAHALRDRATTLFASREAGG